MERLSQKRFADLVADEKVVTLVGTVNAEMLASLNKQLNYFRKLEQDDDVVLVLSTQGGDVTHGISVYNTIAAWGRSRRLWLVASGTIESMGLYILMAVPRERRLAYSFTNFYAHRVEVTYSYNHKAGIEQHQYWLKEQEAYLDRAFTEEEQIMRIVESGTKLDWDAVKRLYNQPQHFGTEKAIEWGFIGGLFE